MGRFVQATCGDNIVVVELGPDVFALVNGDECLFAKNPDSFYKQGYYTEPEKPFTSGQIRAILKTIKKTIDEMTDKNYFQYCLGTTKEKVEEAYNSRVK